MMFASQNNVAIQLERMEKDTMKYKMINEEGN